MIGDSNAKTERSHSCNLFVMFMNTCSLVSQCYGGNENFPRCAQARILMRSWHLNLLSVMRALKLFLED